MCLEDERLRKEEILSTRADVPISPTLKQSNKNHYEFDEWVYRKARALT